MNQNTIYIIGAGVSGLIAAYELEQAGHKPIIIEQADDVGGRVKTLHRNGYPLDFGFQVLLSAYPLANQYLDMDALKLQKLESGALIYANGQSYQIGDPLRNWKVLLPTLLANVGSISDKLKILRLNNRLKQKSLEEIFETPETTTHAYLENFGFSDKIIQRFFRPFFAGIFLEPDIRTSSRMFEFVYKMFGEGYATVPRDGIGAISAQLKGKLKNTEFRFNTEVSEVTNDQILLKTGEKFDHGGTIITGNASALIHNMRNQETEWKSCLCLYFEVDKTNIPEHTIALVADSGNLSNNLYAYTDNKSGKNILSVTALEYDGKTNQEMVERITKEVRQFTGARQVTHIESFQIDQALPDIQNLHMTAEPSESKLADNIFLAGDYLFNGSLNAAMESGRLAAQGILENSEKFP